MCRAFHTEAFVRAGETALFVLPSTSPANAAVPYAERLKWFVALRQGSDPMKSS